MRPFLSLLLLCLPPTTTTIGTKLLLDAQTDEPTPLSHTNHSPAQ